MQHKTTPCGYSFIYYRIIPLPGFHINTEFVNFMITEGKNHILNPIKITLPNAQKHVRQFSKT